MTIKEIGFYKYSDMVSILCQMKDAIDYVSPYSCSDEDMDFILTSFEMLQSSEGVRDIIDQYIKIVEENADENGEDPQLEDIRILITDLEEFERNWYKKEN